MRKKYIIIMISIFFVFLTNVSAAGTASISVSKTKIENGDKVTASVTIKNAAAWNITITSSGATSGCTQKFAGNTDDGKNTSKTFSVTCKSTSTGIINFVMSGNISNNDGTENGALSNISGSKSVTVVTPREKSSNNKLKSLSVEGYEISPKFDKNINEYSVTVPSTVEKINISAKKADGYASLDGTGEKTIEEGVNTFEIVVTSETGVSNTYKLTVNVMDQNPIEVTVNGKKYTVVKVAKNLVKPELFDETTIKINEFDIPAFVNEASKYTLVGLKDVNGNIELFVYKDGEYSKYNEYVSDKLSIVFLKMDKVPTNYKKTTITINEEKVDAYRLIGDNKALVYGLNLATGKKNYYTYDKEEKTLQIFDIENYEDSQKEIKNSEYLIYGLTICTLVSIILVILFAIKSSKMKKLLKLKIADENKRNVIEENKHKKKNKKGDK